MDNSFIEYNLVDDINIFETILLTIDKSLSAYEFIPDGKEESIHRDQLLSKLSSKITEFLFGRVETFSFIDTRDKYEELENNINSKYLITNQLIMSELSMSKYYKRNISNRPMDNIDFFGYLKNTECYMDIYAHINNTTCYCFDDKVICNYNIEKFEDSTSVMYKLRYELEFEGVVESIYFIRE